jgi:hypothetical protein
MSVIYVCVPYVCIFMCVCVCVWMCACACMRVYTVFVGVTTSDVVVLRYESTSLICVCTVFMYVCVYLCVYIFISVCVDVRVRMYACIYSVCGSDGYGCCTSGAITCTVSVFEHVCMYVCFCACMYVYIICLYIVCVYRCVCRCVYRVYRLCISFVRVAVSDLVPQARV